MSRRVAGNSLWLMAQPLLLNVLSIASNFYIARKLGAAGYGVFNLGFAQVALFTPLCNLGLMAVTVRAIAQNRSDARVVTGSACALWSLSIGAAALLALGWVALPIYRGDVRLLGLAATAGMIMTYAAYVPMALFRGFERFRLVTQPRMVGGLALTVLSVLALAVGLGLPGFVAAYILGTAVTLALLLVSARREFFPIRPVWDWPRMRSMAMQARPFAMMSLLTPFLNVPVVDLLILGALFGSGSVGPYTAAMGLIGRLFLLPESIGDALFPAIASRYGESRAEVEAAVRRSVLTLFLVTVPVALCLSFTAPTVLWLLYGNQYVSAAPVLRVAAWLLPLNGACYMLRECLAAVHRQAVVVAISFAGGTALLLLYAVCIPTLGFLGAALAGLAQAVLMLTGLLVASAASFRRPVPAGEVARGAAALACMALPLLPLLVRYHHGYAVGAAAGSFLVYGVALLALRLVSLPALLSVLRRRSGTAAATC